jgi:hypothetical protein
VKSNGANSAPCSAGAELATRKFKVAAVLAGRVTYLPAINALAIALLMVRSNSPASINQPKSLASSSSVDGLTLNDQRQRVKLLLGISRSELLSRVIL